MWEGGVDEDYLRAVKSIVSSVNVVVSEAWFDDRPVNRPCPVKTVAAIGRSEVDAAAAAAAGTGVVMAV